jgi:hypothetical protein
MGYKTFNPGDVLGSADVMDYLMRQTVIGVADEDERDAIPAPQDGMHVWVEDDEDVHVYHASIPGWRSGKWQSFTPAWGGITLGGSASNTGRLTRRGRTIIAEAYLIGGTGTAVTGSITLDTPAPFPTRWDGMVASAWCRPTGGDPTFPLTPFRVSGAALTLRYMPVTSGIVQLGNCSATLPATWNSNLRIFVQMIFETTA